MVGGSRAEKSHGGLLPPLLLATRVYIPADSTSGRMADRDLCCPQKQAGVIEPVEPHGRARSTRQAARPPEFARRAPTGSQQGTGSYVRTYGITARIPSLEVDPPAIGSYGPQKHTFLKSTPFPKFPKH